MKIHQMQRIQKINISLIHAFKHRLAIYNGKDNFPQKIVKHLRISQKQIRLSYVMVKQDNNQVQLMLCLSKQMGRLASQAFLKKSQPLSVLKYCFASKTIPLPFLADSINEGTIANFTKKEGQWVQLDQTVANIETDKVTVEIKSPVAGLVTKLHPKEGETLGVGKPLFDVDPEGAKPAGSPTSAAKEAPKVEAAKAQDKPKAAEPTKQAPKAADKPKEAPKASSPSTPSVPSGQRVQTREAMSRLRQRVSQRLKESQNTYALLTTFQEVDMLQAQRTRQQLGQDFQKKYNIKLGFMSFFLKAATLALQEYPVVNSVIDGNQIVRRNFVDISVAVATPTGLLVPVLRNCQNMKFHDFENGLANLAKKGKQGKITIEDMQGGTFTVSNGGTFGSLMGTPIINPPQSAILGMHSIINRPVVRGDEIVARPMMYLALTYDHRLLDGKDAVLFLKRIQTLIENPKRMLLEI